MVQYEGGPDVEQGRLGLSRAPHISLTDVFHALPQHHLVKNLSSSHADESVFQFRLPVRLERLEVPAGVMAIECRAWSRSVRGRGSSSGALLAVRAARGSGGGGCSLRVRRDGGSRGGGREGSDVCEGLDSPLRWFLVHCDGG